MEHRNPSHHSSHERILVLQTAFLGDIVLSTSFLRALRDSYPQAAIALLTTKGGIELLTPNPWQIQLFSYDKRGSENGVHGFRKKLKEIKLWQPTKVFCLHRSFRSAFLARLSGAKEIWGFQEAAGSFLYTNLVSRKKFLYEAEKNYALLQVEKAVSGHSLFPELAFSSEDQAAAYSLLGFSAEKKYFVLSPSSVWATKRWPADRFGESAAALWREFSLEPVIIAGNSPEDLDSAQIVTSRFHELTGAYAHNLAGKTPLGVLKAILANAEVVLANDSAPLHMAVAVGAPVLAVFGATTKSLGFFPLAPEGKAAVAEVQNLSCRPCGLHGHRRCPEKHFRCMLDLKPAQVIEELRSLLHRN